MRTELRPLALEFPSGQGFACRQERDSHCCQCSKAGSSTRNHGALSEGIFPHLFFNVVNHYELNKLQEELQDLELESMLT